MESCLPKPVSHTIEPTCTPEPPVKMSTQPTPKIKSLRIGVMLENVQLSDIISIDILGNLSQAYLSQIKSMSPEAAAQCSVFDSHALDVEFFYIASTMEPTITTPPIFCASSPGNYGGFKFVPNTTYDTCPRDLDILLIGGPLPSHRPPQAKRFMQEAWTKTRVVMTTCTGSMWLADAGLLEGKTVTTNKGFLEVARLMHPNVKWEYKRWVVEEKEYDGTPDEGKKGGELWTSGAAGTGIDMVARYCLDNFDHEFVNAMALEGLEFNPGGRKGQLYEVVAAEGK